MFYLFGPGGSGTTSRFPNLMLQGSAFSAVGDEKRMLHNLDLAPLARSDCNVVMQGQSLARFLQGWNATQSLNSVEQRSS